MAHGNAVQYVGDHSRFIPGVEQTDMLPDAEDSLPVDPYTGERWTFKGLVATGDYAWAPVAEVAAAQEAAPEPEAAPEKARVPLGSRANKP